MAKRDKTPEWKPPEFDEVEFMHKEMRAAKATLLVVLWTVPSALLSFGLTVAGAAIVAFFAGIGMMFLLKWIFPILKVDISEYKRKDWLGHGVTFFFSWLAFWILLLNPPFADLTSPVILGVSSPNFGSTACWGSLNITTPRSIILNVTASDNVAVSAVTVTIAITGATTDLTHVPGTLLWQSTPVSVPNQTTATIRAVDTSGHSTTCDVLL